MPEPSASVSPRRRRHLACPRGRARCSRGRHGHQACQRLVWNVLPDD
ncbi:hypothetical protein ACFFX0_25735 [Citricoccus parietis]|uniref:Uncharacterized protein n=1 Tax=Citricoccus parietis TaxID=592307 RepID=A0ABV5G685_9MICC